MLRVITDECGFFYLLIFANKLLSAQVKFRLFELFYILIY
jgi:hypothetical protein